MTVSSGPRVRRTAQNTQYTYNLSRRIHTVQTYPVLSPQGATILIYGHDNGVTLVWRGGRKFKAEVFEEVAHGVKGKQNGNKPPSDAVMIIDSDEDDSPATKGPAGFTDKPQFENDVNPNALYPEIVQTLDLSLGSAVFHIATLPITPCAAEDAAWGGADILKEGIVFTVACATREVYLVTLPLTPPSPLSKAREDLRENLLAAEAGHGKWSETLTLLSGQGRPSDGLAMSLIKSKPTTERSKSTDRSQSTTRAVPRVVVAAHTREASGVLRLWDVPLPDDISQPQKSQNRRIEPFQSEYLPSPLSSISFNATHATQLLCNASPHAIRVYDYALASMPPDDLSEGPFPSQGSWLLSLYPPFARPTTSRKPIIAADWIARGRAVLALLADGQWGIWDIDGVSPVSGPVLLGKPQSAGIRGAALTSFSATGYVEGTSPLRNPGTQRTSAGGSNEFVPMTPHSRRDALSTAIGPEKLAAVQGGIEVTPLPARAATTADESVALWIGGAEHVVVIPAIMKFWDAQLRKGSGGGVNLFSGAQPTRMVRLGDLGVGLMGERCIGIGALVRSLSDAGSSANSTTSEEGLPVEVVLCGESRLVVIHESASVVGKMIGGVIGRRKRPSERARESSALIVHPRPEQPDSVTYNLSVHRNGLFDSTPTQDGVLETIEKPTTAEDRAAIGDAPGAFAELPSQSRSTGFAFADSMNAAADAMQQDEDQDEVERDVEVEMLDIMEIDRELSALEDGRGRGRKKVIFDN